MNFTWIAAILLPTLVFYYLIRKMSHWKALGVPQHHPLYSIYLSWFRFFFKMENAAEFLNSIANSFTDARYYGFYILGKPGLFLHDPELVKLVTIKDADHFTDRSPIIPEDIDPLWAKNLFALQGQRWREMRITISPSFTGSKIKEMFILMDDCAERYVHYFLDKGEKITKVDFKDVSSRYCTDIIASVAFGIETDCLRDPNNEFYIYAKDATDIRSFWKSLKFFGFIIAPKIYRLLGMKFFSNDVARYFRNIIDESIKMREDTGFVRHDLINLLMEARKGVEMKYNEDTSDPGFATVKEQLKGKTQKPKNITNEDITAQALLFFFAGFDSVSYEMSFMAHELAENQDVQERLREEIMETYETCGGKLRYDAIAAMKYMDMVVSESMRKWPVLANFDRLCTKPYTLEPAYPGGKPLRLKVGDMVGMCSYIYHRNPKHFPDPEKFDPERFNEDNKKTINPYVYTPFGSGMRNCIGSRFALIEMKVLFFHLLKHFEIVAVPETNIPMKLARTKMGIYPQNGFQLGLKRISN